MVANAYRPFTVSGRVDNDSYAYCTTIAGALLLLLLLTSLFLSFIGPRTHDGELGRWLVSAFIEKDTGRRILVNRGWLPSTDKPPAVEGEVALVGRPRGDGARNSFTPENKPETRTFFRYNKRQHSNWGFRLSTDHLC